MNKTLSVIFLTALITSSGYCQDIAAQNKDSLAIHSSGQNILISSKQFDGQAILNQVNVGMTPVEVVAGIGLPKEIEENTWFYTYEFPDKTGQFKWEILQIDFKRSAVSERFWVPHDSSDVEESFVPIAAVHGSDQETQHRIGVLLNSQSIKNYTEGSVAYGVFDKSKSIVKTRFFEG